MKQNWYKEWFSSKYYLEIYKHRDDKDARNLINLIIEQLNLPSGSKILDICCGAGRHSIELAKRGFNVTGFDLSRFLIEQAKLNLKKNKSDKVKVKFLIKDMRNFNFKNSFELALNLFTSFGYFEDDDENFLIFRNAANSISRNGYFVFDYLNRDFLIKNLKEVSKTRISGKKVLQKRRIENGFVIKDIFIQVGKNELFFTERLKLYSMSDFKKIFKINNLKIITTFGDYHGIEFDKYKSARIIIFAKKN